MSPINFYFYTNEGDAVLFQLISDTPYNDFYLRALIPGNPTIYEHGPYSMNALRDQQWHEFVAEFDLAGTYFKVEVDEE